FDIAAVQRLSVILQLQIPKRAPLRIEAPLGRASLKPAEQRATRRYREASPETCRSNGAIRHPPAGFQNRAGPNMHLRSDGTAHPRRAVPRRTPGCAKSGSSLAVGA